MGLRFSIGKLVLLALFGVVLVCNPIYLYPDGVAQSKTTYSVTGVTNDSTALQALGQDQRVLECPVERPCVLEERVLADGSIRYDGSLQAGQSYPVVRIDDGIYVPRNDVENGTTLLTLEPVTPLEAVAHAATPVAGSESEVRAAVETGSVTVYGERIEAFERGWIVEHDGAYYWNDGFRSSPTVRANDLLLPVLRGVSYVLGIAALLYSGWGARDVSVRSGPSE